MGAVERARHGAGRHPEGGPGPEHLHLLDRVQPQGDGRHRRVLRAPRRAQLLLGVASRATTSPRPARTRSASSPSRCRNGFTFVEAYLARGMHIDDFAPNLSFFFSQRHGPGVHGAGPRGAPHLGGGDARPLRRQRAQPEAEVPRADLGPQPARAGDRSSTTSAPRCRR